jgi:hypothetical protein
MLNRSQVTTGMCLKPSFQRMQISGLPYHDSIDISLLSTAISNSSMHLQWCTRGFLTFINAHINSFGAEVYELYPCINDIH